MVVVWHNDRVSGRAVVLSHVVYLIEVVVAVRSVRRIPDWSSFISYWCYCSRPGHCLCDYAGVCVHGNFPLHSAAPDPSFHLVCLQQCCRNFSWVMLQIALNLALPLFALPFPIHLDSSSRFGMNLNYIGGFRGASVVYRLPCPSCLIKIRPVCGHNPRLFRIVRNAGTSYVRSPGWNLSISC